MLTYLLFLAMLAGIVLLYSLTPDSNAYRGTAWLLHQLRDVFRLYFSPLGRIPRFFKALVSRRRWREFWYEFTAQSEPTSLRALQRMVGTWTKATFVNAGGLGAAHHLEDECGELIELLEEIKAEGMTPERKYKLGLELADIQILTMDICHVQGVDLADSTLLKHYINTQRKWAAPDERGVQHHIEPELDPSLQEHVTTRSEEDIKKLKANFKFGEERLAAIIARPDPVIANAIEAHFREEEDDAGQS